jgi:hypothetical protein
MNEDIKYIGITTQSINNRLSQHLNKPTNIRMKLWFETLKKQNLKPKVEIIKECSSYNDLLESEINEIKKYRLLNQDILNMADGGDINPMFGKTHTSEARAKISGRKKGVKMSEEQKILHRDRIKNLWKDESWSIKVREKMKERNSGEGNPNWRGGISIEHSYCSCGNVKNRHSKTCFSCRDQQGENNPFFQKKHKKETINKILETKKTKGITFVGDKNPNFKYKLNYEDLYELYIIQDKKIDEIANIYNCCINTIKNNLSKLKIKKIRNKYNLNISDIIRHKNDGLNLIEIGNLYGCSNKIICKFIKKNEHVK